MLNWMIAGTGIDYRRYIESQSEDAEQKAKAAQVVLNRRYYNGLHRAKPDQRIKDYLGIDADEEFSINFMPMVVDAYAERLTVLGFTVSIPGEQKVVIDGSEQQTTSDRLAERLAKWRQAGRFDAKQRRAYTGAGRDSTCFVMVDFDRSKNMPRFNINYAFDGEDGVVAHYDHEGNIIYATKQWQIAARYTENGKQHTRLNVYHPDRVELWIRDGEGGNALRPTDPDPENEEESAQLEHRGRPYEATVIWFTDDGTASGEPLGVPVFPFNNNDDGAGNTTSDIENLFVPQEAINKTYLDMLSASDANAYPLLVSENPVQDENGDPIIPGPAQIIEGTGIERIPPGDMSQLVNGLETHISTLARISGVPLSRFTVTKAVSAEGTLKQQESSLLAIVEAKQVDFGNTWEDAVRMAFKLDAIFGERIVDLMAVEDLTIEAQWADSSPRSENETADYVLKVAKLGLPEEEIWSILGYDADKIAEFRKLLDDQASQQLEADIARARNQQFALLQQMGAQARGRRTETNGTNGQQEESAGDGLPQTLAIGA